MKARQRPLISIIVHLQAIGGEVETCLRALQKQTVQACQFLLIHDGQSGNALHVANAMQAVDSRFEVALQMGIGCGAAYNYGLTKVQAPYVMFLSGYDVLAPTACEQLFVELCVHESEVGYCASVEQPWDQQAVPVLQAGATLANKLFQVDFLKRHQLQFREQMWHAQMLFNYEVLLKKPHLEVVNSQLVRQEQPGLKREPNVEQCYDIFEHLQKLHQTYAHEAPEELFAIWIEQIFVHSLPVFWRTNAHDLAKGYRKTQYCLQVLQQYYPDWQTQIQALPFGPSFQQWYGRKPVKKLSQLATWRGGLLVMRQLSVHKWK